eukprot:m.13978 g.13978  ORF g.13978 m.13978 type:complete len:83 (-) comp6085_c0_seq1:38-286(-)
MQFHGVVLLLVMSHTFEHTSTRVVSVWLRLCQSVPRSILRPFHVCRCMLWTTSTCTTLTWHDVSSTQKKSFNATTNLSPSYP